MQPNLEAAADDPYYEVLSNIAAAAAANADPSATTGAPASGNKPY